MSLTKSQRSKVEKALAQHDSKKNSFMWTPSGGASGRRYEEQRNTWTVKFRHAGVQYQYNSHVRCSCKCYYYTGAFYVNGERKNRRAFAKLLTGAA